ncbi:hypothetical protein Pelo_8545 [Pelomyxa schiedti]|nr:hypothetical protein Pelo_8545 [Pelomyxa schiedti]
MWVGTNNVSGLSFWSLTVSYLSILCLVGGGILLGISVNRYVYWNVVSVEETDTRDMINDYAMTYEDVTAFHSNFPPNNTLIVVAGSSNITSDLWEENTTLGYSIKILQSEVSVTFPENTFAGRREHFSVSGFGSDFSVPFYQCKTDYDSNTIQLAAITSFDITVYLSISSEWKILSVVGQYPNPWQGSVEESYKQFSAYDKSIQRLGTRLLDASTPHPPFHPSTITAWVQSWTGWVGSFFLIAAVVFALILVLLLYLLYRASLLSQGLPPPKIELLLCPGLAFIAFEKQLAQLEATNKTQTPQNSVNPTNNLPVIVASW